MATIFNGLKVSDFTLNENPEDYLLFFGRIHPDKGTAEAIEIAKKSNRKLKIVGIIQDSNYFEQHVKPHLNDDIQFLGHSGPESRNELLGKAAALLHPISFNEPFGLSVAEAMMCGTPVIAFNRGSMPELIHHQKNGFLVNDVSEAVKAVSKLPSINRKNCSITAKEKFSSTKMAKEYLKLYKIILEI